MKIMFVFGWALLVVRAVWAQPAMESWTIRLDFDGDQANEMRLEVSSVQAEGPQPQKWFVAQGVHPSNSAVFLKPTKIRRDFARGESIGELGVIALTPDVGVGFSYYRAESNIPTDPRFWTYTTLGDPNFNDRAEFYLGMRLQVEGASHYAWVRFSRPTVDNHTLFELAGHDWNPIPDAPIPAGEPPPPPPLTAVVGDGGTLDFTWDNRLGEMVLEWAERLGAEADWQAVAEAGFSPVSLPPGEGNRFFRLRKP